MNGHGEKLTRFQERAIAALLAYDTVKTAAGKAGVSEKTLREWLKRPEFTRAYREARRQVVEAAIAQLQRITAAAVKALKRNLTCGKAAGEIRAAVAILNHAIRGVEVGDLAERVEELERIILDRDRPKPEGRSRPARAG